MTTSAKQVMDHYQEIILRVLEHHELGPTGVLGFDDRNSWSQALRNATASAAMQIFYDYLPKKGHAEPWLQTHSGGALDLFNPTPEQIHINDIAHHLALQCRYAGACFALYSVAQHSVLAAHFVRPQNRELQLAALLHDAAEAYISDIPAPFKKRFPQIQAAEDVLLTAIYKRFGVAFTTVPQEVKVIDACLCNMERQHLHEPSPREDGWPDMELFPPVEVDKGWFDTWSMHESERRFLATFGQLMDGEILGEES